MMSLGDFDMNKNFEYSSITDKKISPIGPTKG
jgi:hypothetical protein